MRVELIPLLIGIAVAALAMLVLVDAAADPELGPLRERRRRVRATIDRRGEVACGIGILGFAVALIGRDSWEQAPWAVGIGALLVTYGAFRNRHYLREAFFFRGAARRKDERPSDSRKLRIR